MKPVLLKDELISQTQPRNPKNHGARGKHTFDDDDEDDLGLEGGETEDLSSKPKEVEFGAQLSKYYKGFAGNQPEEGQEEQLYDLYYNYDGSGSNAGSKNSEDGTDRRANYYANSGYHDGSHHYAGQNQEDQDNERAYISKNQKSAKADNFGSHVRHKDTKSNINSQHQPNNKNRPHKTHQTRNEYAEPSKQRKEYENNYEEDNYYETTNQGTEHAAQFQKPKSKNFNPQSPDPQEDPKEVKKPKTKQVYYVSKGDSQHEAPDYHAGEAEPDYDYQGSYGDYNYDSRYNYPVNGAQNTNHFRPQPAYNLHQPKTALPKQQAYSKESPVHTAKETNHPEEDYPEEFSSSDHRLGSYNYSQPRPEVRRAQYVPYYSEQDYGHGYGQDSYNLYPQGHPSYSEQPEWDHQQEEDATGSPALHNYYAPVHAPVRGPVHQQALHNDKLQSAKLPKPSRGGAN